ncbi:OmpA family protein [Novosphingobium sp. AP12]|uniref:OmpA family protein n=1 Tax=Novosphingobium sp. AP12 TaxID=1144305 RepID=UPI000271E304|nr:OmpA family protein [Novosphingobium sp. AP12]EJL21957.1 outer membrane protein/peptidoglycan-associated lipoprotein [Novosphingobium sp. AP12]
MKGFSALSAALTAAPLFLAACQPAGETNYTATEAAVPDDAGDPSASEAPDDIVKKSIIRAEVDTGPTEAPPIEPTQVTVPFSAKGNQPDDGGMALVDGLLKAPAYLAGGPVTIWGHSDSKGSDAENLAASRRRAEAVRDHLESKGVPPDRMTVVALGEARPIAPNRKLDGTDDLEGRAKNRRVDVRVDLPPPPPAGPSSQSSAPAKP